MEANCMTKNKKPVYETPVIMPLGELARGLGAACKPGSSPTGTCNQGNGVPPRDCTRGNKAGSTCNRGNQVGP